MAQVAFDSVDSFLSRVASQYEGLPRQLQAVARHVEENRARMVVTRITDIAAACSVQPSAVTRFAQRFGFSGYSELQALFRRAFSERSAPAASYARRIRDLARSGKLRRDPGGVMRQLLLANQGAIEEWAMSLDDAALAKAVDLLHDADDIYVAGVRRSAPAATYLTYLLQHTSKRVILVSGLGGTFVGQMRSIRRGDLLVAISFAPYGKETRGCVRIAHARGAAILSITDSAMSPVARPATTHLLVKEASAFAFRSLTNTLCLCQGLFIALASRLELDLEAAHQGAIDD
ncbi:MAG TPA: MurR/RpiR family transcriptional regulator [Anaeromyxobacteraceae bacterium]|nr:MurR/RpiR family transcriptional regulator [Anaeromyxobacteraceae bacterium]